MLLLKAKTVPTCRNPLRKDRSKLSRRRHSCSYRSMDALVSTPPSAISDLVPALRLTHIHRAVGLFERAAGFGMQTEERDAGRRARGHRAATKDEGEPVDHLLQRRRL